MSSFALLADRSISLREHVEVQGGALGARATSTTGTIVPGFTLSVNAHADSSQAIFGSWVKLFEYAQVGPVSTDHFTSLPQAQYGTVSSFALPPALPALQPVSPGTTAVTILWSNTETRPAGAYSTIELKEGATLNLSGGLYEASSLLLRPNARIQAQAPVQIRVTGAITFLEQTSLLSTGVGMTASSIRVQSSATSPSSTGTPSIELRPQVSVKGLFLAPNGTILVREHVTVTGALAAQDIEVYPQAAVTFQDGFSGGTCPASCDDGNACTTDACSNGTCTHSAVAVGTSCLDSNACNGAETCNASGACIAGTPPTLDDGNPCTTDACSASQGVTHLPVASGTSCSDGNACNGLETCNGQATCQAGQAPTLDDNNPCTTDSCSTSFGIQHVAVAAGTPCLDGNACNGAEACDSGGVCRPGTPSAIDDGNPCTADSCDPQQGVLHAPVTSGTSCSDGNACNGLEVCTGGGQCAAGTAPTVDDGNPCTIDTCDPQTGVRHVVRSAGTSCSDGNACNGLETCNGQATCQAGQAPALDDNNPCTTDSCSPATGVSHANVAEGTTCSDGNACNGAETCSATGVCRAGTPPAIDDGNPCTTDTCQPTTGVSHSAQPAGTSCSDGNACNGLELCDGHGSCNPGPAPALDDGNPCTTDSCQPSGGVVHTATPSGASCSDGNDCNGSETCDGQGHCQSGTSPVLDDGNACTIDACAPSVGVTHQPVTTGSPCEDQNQCNGSERCDAQGHCQAGQPPALDDGNPCTADSCDALTGIRHAPLAQGSPCSDGDACNGLETCNAQGSCLGSAAPTVDDGNPCTIDTCDPQTGVRHVAQSAGTSCSDGDACNGAEACDAQGHCQAGQPPTLDDGNPCTTDSCSPATGVTHTLRPDGSSCSEGNACQQATCNATGHCTTGQQVALDDGNPCTVDSCDAATGVTHTPDAPGAPCPDSNVCNGLEVCNGSGACIAGVPLPLDDGDPCTLDTCDPQTGIHHGPTAAGTNCSDGNACNGLEVCNGQGACQSGQPPTLDDGNGCTVDACDPATGVTHSPATGASCSDGDACNGLEACNATGQCVPGAPALLDDSNPCTADACDPLVGVTHTPVAPGLSCSDGNPCNGNERCSGSGVCQTVTFPFIDDGNPCTVDECSPSTGITHSPVVAGTSCSDGDVCNGVEVCDGLGGCVPGSSLVLDDGDPCTADSCDPGLGVAHAPVAAGTSCSDGNVCNGSETCDANGVCQAGIAFTPDDGNPCTDDTCDPATGIHHTMSATGASCDDGNACNGDDTCDGAGHCLSNPYISYNDGNPCTIDDCAPATGITHTPVPEGTSCSDYNPCNGAEVCNVSGQCVAGPPPTLDDGNPCTDDVCYASYGVYHWNVAWGTSCDDGNPNNGSETCDGAGHCAAPGSPTVDDGNPCTADAYDPFTGVTHTPLAWGTSCSDGNECNGAERCDGVGTCLAGPPPSLDDGNACTTDTCDPTTGAEHTLAAAGTSCQDSNPCNGDEVCDSQGQCTAGTVTLDDGNACTTDSCSPVTGITHQPVNVNDGNGCTFDGCDPSTGITHTLAPEGTDCSDGNACNGFERCSAFGLCLAGQSPALDDGNPCTVDSCDATSGVRHLPVAGGTSCRDSNVCNGDEICDGQGHCLAGTPLALDDGNPCTADQCDPVHGVLHPLTSAHCSTPASRWAVTTSRPSPRDSAAMAFDAQRGKILLFGGENAGVALGDTWELDPASGQWTVSYLAGPGPRAGAVALFDPTLQRVLLFGGVRGHRESSDYLDDLWSYDGSAGAWATISPTGHPYPRAYASWAYDTQLQVGVLFGGTGGPQGTIDFADTWHWRSATQSWAAKSVVGPGARGGAAMAYDPQRGKILLFGGATLHSLGAPPLADTWEYDASTSAWTQLTPALSPPARAGHSMVFDPSLGRILVHGGVGVSPKNLSDAWAYDASASTWTELSPDQALPAGPGQSTAALTSSTLAFGGLAYSLTGEHVQDTRSLHERTSTGGWKPRGGDFAPAKLGPGLAYDPSRQQLIARGTEDYPLVWEYSLTTERWTPRDSLAGQEAYGKDIAAQTYGSFALFYDLATGKTVNLLSGQREDLFGHPATGPGVYLWDGTRWDRQACAPVPGQPYPWAIANASTTYDPQRKRAMLFGGYEGLGATDALWELDVAACRWTRHSGNLGPGPRLGSYVAWDRDRDVLVLHGGWRQVYGYEPPLNDTWEWSPATDTWQLTPATFPGWVLAATFAYDPLSHRTLLFGGEGQDYTARAETWAYDGAAHTWTKLSPAHSPPPRMRARMTFDETRGRLVLLGGEDEDGRLLRDWWDWDGSDWNRHLHGGHPSARNGAAGTWSPWLRAGLLFGGVSGDGQRALLGDLWLWQDGEWFTAPSSSLFNEVPSAELEGTVSPPRRAGHALAFSPGGDSYSTHTGLLFGGEGDAGFLDDTWQWDPNDMRWTWMAYSPLPGISSYPSARADHALVAVSERMFMLFGGRSSDGTPLGDTWSWEYGWEVQRGIPGQGPSPRSGHGMATDLALGKVILFGGRDASGALSDTWEWTPPLNIYQGGFWTRRQPPVSPPAMFGHRLSYDSVRGKVLLTGGWGNDPAVVQQQTWEWDGNAGTWALRNPSVPLEPRVGHVSFFDEHQGQTMVIGGLAYDPAGDMASTYGDQWVFTDADQPDAVSGQRALGNACTTSSDCASSQCVEGVCCNSACDLACGSCTQPGHVGTCSPLVGAPRLPRSSCQGEGACAPRCDGSDMLDCHTPVNTPCLVPGCQDGVENTVGACQADGTCTVGQHSCAPFFCQGDHCATTCADSSDCQAPYFCPDASWAQGACQQRSSLNYFYVTPATTYVNQTTYLIASASGWYPSYRFSVLRDSVREYPCGDYSPYSWCPWLPSDSGHYEVTVEVRSEYSTQAPDETSVNAVEVQ